METTSNMNELSKKMDTAYGEGTTSQSAKKKKKLVPEESYGRFTGGKS